MTALSETLLLQEKEKSASITLDDYDLESPSIGKGSTVVVYIPLSAPLSSNAKKHFTKLESFINLEENWDSYGANPVSPSSIYDALKFICFADYNSWQVYFVAPGKNGDVLVELKVQNGLAAEIYFNPDHSKELLIFQEDDCLYEGEFDPKVLVQYFDGS